MSTVTMGRTCEDCAGTYYYIFATGNGWEAEHCFACGGSDLRVATRTEIDHLERNAQIISHCLDCGEVQTATFDKSNAHHDVAALKTPCTNCGGMRLEQTTVDTAIQWLKKASNKDAWWNFWDTVVIHGSDEWLEVLCQASIEAGLVQDGT